MKSPPVMLIPSVRVDLDIKSNELDSNDWAVYYVLDVHSTPNTGLSFRWSDIYIEDLIGVIGLSFAGWSYTKLGTPFPIGPFRTASDACDALITDLMMKGWQQDGS